MLRREVARGSEVGIARWVQRRERLVLAAVVVAASLGAAAAAGLDKPGLRALGALMAIGSLSGIMATIAARTRYLGDRAARIEKRVVKSEKHSSRAAYFGEKLPLIARDIQGIQRRVEDQSGSHWAIRETVEISRDSAQNASLYQTDLVKSWRKPERPHAAKPGRLAADQVEDPESGAKLWRVLTADPDHGRQVVVGVFSPAMKNFMGAEFDLREVAPGADPGLDVLGASYFVVDHEAFDAGRWLGADSAEGTSLFLRLRSAIQFARRQRSVIVSVIEDDRSWSHFTGDLLDLSDVVIGPSSSDLRWAPDSEPRVLQLLRSRNWR